MTSWKDNILIENKQGVSKAVVFSTVPDVGFWGFIPQKPDYSVLLFSILSEVWTVVMYSQARVSCNSTLSCDGGRPVATSPSPELASTQSSHERRHYSCYSTYTPPRHRSAFNSSRRAVLGNSPTAACSSSMIFCGFSLDVIHRVANNNISPVLPEIRCLPPGALWVTFCSDQRSNYRIIK